MFLALTRTIALVTQHPCCLHVTLLSSSSSSSSSSTSSSTSFTCSCACSFLSRTVPDTPQLAELTTATAAGRVVRAAAAGRFGLQVPGGGVPGAGLDRSQPLHDLPGRAGGRRFLGHAAAGPVSRLMRNHSCDQHCECSSSAAVRNILANVLPLPAAAFPQYRLPVLSLPNVR